MVVWSEVESPFLFGAKVALDGSVLIAPTQFGQGMEGVFRSGDLTTNDDGTALTFTTSSETVWLVGLMSDFQTAGFPRSLASEMGTSRPSVAVGHERFAVVWANSNGVQVGLAPADLDGATEVVSVTTQTSARQPWIVTTERGFLVVWVDARTGAAEIYGADLPIGGDPDRFTVTTDERPSSSPRLANAQGSIGVTWGDYNDGSDPEALYFATLDESSLGVTVPVRIVADADQSPDPAIASNGDDFFVVSEDGASGSITGVRIIGEFRDTHLVADDAVAPDIAWGQDRYGVVWVGQNEDLSLAVFYRWLRF